MHNEMTTQAAPVPVMTGTAATIFSPDGLDKLLRFAEVMANGRVTVPAHLAGKPADCLAVTMQAAQWRMNPFAVAQKTFTINGTLGYEAQLVNAIVTTMAPTRDRLHYQWFGNWEKIIGNFTEKTSPKGNKYIAPAWQLADESGCGVRVWATMKGEDEPRTLELFLSQAQVRNSTLWASDPKQQLAYLAVKRWARLHCPDVILGVYTPDELETVKPVERDITPPPVNDLNALINHPVTPEPQHSIGAESIPEVNSLTDEPVAETQAPSQSTTKIKATTTKQNAPERSADQLLADFVEAASSTKTVSTLARCYAYASQVLKNKTDHLDKATDVFLVRKAELEEEAENLRTRSQHNGGK